MGRVERLFPLLPDQPTLLAEWKSLVVTYQCQGKVSHDARLVAAMRTHGLTDILTFNVGDFQRYPGLTVIDPAKV
jgi:predicted nucleic acid-binding protein